jgi:hypothetical protein
MGTYKVHFLEYFGDLEKFPKFGAYIKDISTSELRPHLIILKVTVISLHLLLFNMRLVWSYSGHEFFCVLLLVLAIEATAAETPPIVDLGYALHQATILSVNSNSTPDSKSPANSCRKTPHISNSQTSDIPPLP